VEWELKKNKKAQITPWTDHTYSQMKKVHSSPPFVAPFVKDKQMKIKNTYPWQQLEACT
jgi:hypothetical protein